MASKINIKRKTEPSIGSSSLKRSLALVEEYDSDDEYDENPKKKGDHVRNKQCPYLDTINRSVLDFDFEKLCSVSLSHLNVYACLVCGKYFQGRGQNSHAYTHSVRVGHHVYLNLHTLKFYCLPDNYEVIDSSLDDIKFLLKPIFTNDQISKLDASGEISRALDGTLYLPGVVGLNNIKANDYLNVVLQVKHSCITVVSLEPDLSSVVQHLQRDLYLEALAFVTPVRNYFLKESNYRNLKRPPGDTMFPIVQRFGELMRKIWNPRHFKAHVSPHEMLQAVVSCSKKKFQFTEQGDPIEFLSWFLNALHLTLNGTKKPKSSIIYKTFRGTMFAYSRKLPQTENEEEIKRLLQQEEYKEKKTEAPYLYLTLDIPAAPLFQDELESNIIPQVPLLNLLQKFNSIQEKEYKSYKETQIKRFKLTGLPSFLIIYIKRFTNNTFFIEKNPTVVNFPVKNLDMREFLANDPEVHNAHPCTSYDLIANICHEGEPGAGKGSFRVHVYHKGSKQWFELQDLHVKEILPPMITLSDSYIQIWELQKSG